MSGAGRDEFTPGTRVGDYEVVRTLGRGGAGVVYEVLKVSVAKRMALKVLHRSLVGGDDDIQRFGREAMIAGAIEHPNVMQVFDVGQLEGHYYMAMELLTGETLQDRLERDGALPARTVADLFVPLMSALAAVHDQGIVHRDLKPGNIFLVARRAGVVEPKLLDFGVIKDLSGIVGGDMTRAHSLVGSPAYMSPEQVEQTGTVDTRSDVFSVGSILWECLAGRQLFAGATLFEVAFKIVEEPVPSLCTLRPEVPVALDALVLRALERDPARRVASAREIGLGLLPYASDHIRALWRDDLAGEDGFEEEATSMMQNPARMATVAPSGQPLGAAAAPIVALAPYAAPDALAAPIEPRPQPVAQPLAPAAPQPVPAPEPLAQPLVAPLPAWQPQPEAHRASVPTPPPITLEAPAPSRSRAPIVVAVGLALSLVAAALALVSLRAGAPSPATTTVHAARPQEPQRQTPASAPGPQGQTPAIAAPAPVPQGQTPAVAAPPAPPAPAVEADAGHRAPRARIRRK